MSYGSQLISLPAEQHLPPVIKFNATVGPLLNAIKPRLPFTDEHRDSSLMCSCTMFVQYCFDDCRAALEKLKPSALGKEEWLNASEETKEAHRHWQKNLRYLRQRLRYYLEMIGVPYSNQKGYAQVYHAEKIAR